MYTGTSLADIKDARIASRAQARVEDRKLRLLALAVLASLFLHALILLFLSNLREFGQARAVPPPLTARLAKPKPPPEMPIVEPPPQRLPASPRVVRTQPHPLPAVAPPILSVEPAKQVSEPAFVVPAAPSTPGPPSPSVASSAGPEAQPAATAGGGPDPGSIARFRLELMDLARRYKRYPRIAQENNWEGRVELRLAFSENGTLGSLSVKKGAGRTVLDEEAQAMLRRAQAQVSIPPALRGKAFALEIPVDFFLKDEDR